MIMQWAEKEPTTFALFADQLYCAFETRIKIALTEKNVRVQLVTHFNKIILSSTYKLFWQNLTDAAKCVQSPITNYHISNQVYMAFMKKFQKNEVGDSSRPNIVELTPDEMGAITYIGGYIIRHLIKKLTKKNPPNKNSLLLLLFNLLNDPESSDNVQVVDIFNIQNWSKLIDRGGLFHCIQSFVDSLLEMERIVKRTIDNIIKDKTTITNIKTNILECPKISEHWNNSFIDNESSSANSKYELFNYIIDEYLTLRGFAFAARFMERY